MANAFTLTSWGDQPIGPAGGDTASAPGFVLQTWGDQPAAQAGGGLPRVVDEENARAYPKSDRLDRGGMLPSDPSTAPLYKRAADLFTGNLRTEFPNAPEFVNRWMQQEFEAKGPQFNHSLIGRSAVSPDPLAQLDILRKEIPGLQVGQDRYGNPMARRSDNETWAYINKPGASGRDMDEASILAALSYPATRALAVGTGVAARTGIAAAGAGATSVGQDLLAQTQGSKQGIDWGRAGLSAAAGGALQLGMEGAQALANALRTGGPVVVGGQLTANGRRAAEAAGLDPATMSPDAIAAFDRVASQLSAGQRAAVLNGVDGAGNALGAATRSEQFGLGFTPGQMTGNVGRQTAEQAALGGAKGARTQAAAQRLATQQADDISGAVERTYQRFGGGSMPAGSTAADIGDALGGSIATGARQAKDAASDALETALQGSQSVLRGDAWRRMVNDIPQAAHNSGVPFHEGTPSAVQFWNMLRRAVPENDPPLPGLVPYGTIAGNQGRSAPWVVTFKRMEELRQNGNMLLRSSRGTPDEPALRFMLRQIDDLQDEAFLRGWATGTPQELTAIRQARSQYRDMKQTWGANDQRTSIGRFQDAAGRFMERIVGSAEAGQPMAGETIAKTLFNAARTGYSDVAQQMVARIERAFGANSPQMDMMRQGAVQYLLTNPKTGALKAPGHLQTDLAFLTSGSGRTYAERLFTGEQLQVLAELQDALRRTLPSNAALNPSQSAWKGAGMFRNAITRLAQTVGLADVFAHGGAGGMALAGGAELAKRGLDQIAARQFGRFGTIAEIPATNNTVPLGPLGGLIGGDTTSQPVRPPVIPPYLRALPMR